MKKVIVIVTILLLASCAAAYAITYTVDTEAVALISIKYGVDQAKCYDVIKDYVAAVKGKMHTVSSTPVSVFTKTITILSGKYGIDTKKIALMLMDYDLLVAG